MQKLLAEFGFLPSTISGHRVLQLRSCAKFIGIVREIKGDKLFDELRGPEVVQVGLLQLGPNVVAIYAYGDRYEGQLRDVLAEAVRIFEVPGDYVKIEDEEVPLNLPSGNRSPRLPTF